MNETKQPKEPTIAWYWYVWTIIICLPVWLSWAASAHWLLELFTHFRAQYTVGLVLLGLPLFWKRRYQLSAVIGGTMMTQLFAVLPLFVGGDAAAASKGTKTYKLLLANVHSANQQHKPLYQLIEKEKPDVLVLLEISPAWADALLPLRKTYTQGSVLPQANNFGIAVLSRHPTRKLTTHRFGPLGVHSMSMQVQLGGRWTWIVGTHPLPPIGGQMAMARDIHMQKLGAFLAAQKGPRILAGDLNATSWSPAFGQLVAKSGLQDSRKGLGIQPTWMVHTLLFALPIDHILVSKNIQIHRRFIGPDIGSDHRPVLLEYSRRQTQ